MRTRGSPDGSELPSTTRNRSLRSSSSSCPVSQNCSTDARRGLPASATSSSTARLASSRSRNCGSTSSSTEGGIGSRSPAKCQQSSDRTRRPCSTAARATSRSRRGLPPHHWASRAALVCPSPPSSNESVSSFTPVASSGWRSMRTSARSLHNARSSGGSPCPSVVTETNSFPAGCRAASCSSGHSSGPSRCASSTHSSQESAASRSARRASSADAAAVAGERYGSGPGPETAASAGGCRLIRRRRGARAGASSSRRVLPMPDGPATKMPRGPRRDSNTRRICSSSPTRPTKGEPVARTG